MAEEAVAYRFRDPDFDGDWCHAGAEELDDESREILEEEGWEVQPLTTMEREDGD